MTERFNSRALASQAAEISVSTAARMAGCSPDTVLRWIEEGAIEARRISPRGWWKVKKKSLALYLYRLSGNAQPGNTANSARISRAAHRV